MRTCDHLQAEIVERFGFLPPFFTPALQIPEVLENLWQQTLSAYVNNPIRALFKEKLFAYLSRYCAVPYCIVCHSCALRPLGMTAAQVLALLEAPGPAGDVDIEEDLSLLVAEPGPLKAWPAANSALEECLFRSSVYVFVNPDPEYADRIRTRLRRLLGPTNYAHWTAFLAYVRTCHAWVEAHPELSYEADKRAQEHLGALLQAEPRLADFFRSYSELVQRERQRHEELRAGARAERREAEELRQALAQSRQHAGEASALLEASRALSERHTFTEAAQAIFEPCKTLIGATAGYVALLTKDGTENDVLFLDSGGLPCTVDSTLPMPIRGLRAEAYGSGMPVYHNAFSESAHVEFLPDGHVHLTNVLFAPLVSEGKAVGLLGLANKPEGFTDKDARLASAFADLAAVSLTNSRTLDMLMQSEARFRSVAKSANDAIISIDSTGSIILWNDAAERAFGYTADEALGQPLTLIVPPRLREAHENALHRAVSTGRLHIIGTTVEVVGLRKDGREFPVELSLASWGTTEGTFFTGIIREITDRKRAEEEIRTLNEALGRRASELEAANKELEAFSYSVSHDLQAPLRAIDGFSRILVEEYAPQLSPEARRYLETVRENTKKMGRLIDDLLTFSRLSRQALNGQPVSPADLARETLEGLRAGQEDRYVEITIGNLPTCQGDPALLKQVFINLLSNALKFTRDREIAVIEIGCLEEAEGRRQEAEGRGQEAALAPNPVQSAISNLQSAIYFVRDNGVGFDMRYAHKLFNVFQRLHPAEEYEGTGVGLAIVQRIIHRHGGRVWAEATPDKGATFYFTI